MNNKSIFVIELSRELLRDLKKRFKKKKYETRVRKVSKFLAISILAACHREAESSRVEPIEPERRRSGKIGAVREMLSLSATIGSRCVYTVDRESR